MTISFGGVPMLLETPGAEIDAFIKKFWNLPTNPINTAPRLIDSRSICQIPNWPRVPNLKLNQLYQPSGATRWSRGLFLTDDFGIQQLNGISYGVLTMGLEYPTSIARSSSTSNYIPTPRPSGSSSSGTVVVPAGGWNIGDNFSMIMFKLDPIPISIKSMPRQVTQQYGNYLYLVPLVDERYFWQGINIVSTAIQWGTSAIPPCGSSSASSSSSSSGGCAPTLLNDIATALSTGALGSPTPDQYISGSYFPNGVPACAAYRNGPFSAAAALDLMCWSQNLLLVPDDSTNTTFIRSVGNIQRYRLLGGGQNDPNRTSSSSGAIPPTPPTIAIGQKNAALWYGGPQSVAGNDKYNAVAADVPAAISMTYTSPTVIAQKQYNSLVIAPGSIANEGTNVLNLKGLATADGLVTSSSSSATFIVPGNQSDLDALTKQWVNNWYTTNAISFDWVFNNMPILKFCGVEDHILFDMAKKRKGYSAFTRWVSLPSHFGYEYVAFETLAHATDLCGPVIQSSSSGSSSGGPVATGCVNCGGCITFAQATVGGCDAAPDGAAYQYVLQTGAWAFSDSGGTATTTTFTYGEATGCSSSSSISSSSSSSGGACSWYSCPVLLCQPSTSSSSSSSSSSGGPVCGVYQLRLDMTTGTSLDGTPCTVETVYIIFVGGDNWMGA